MNVESYISITFVLFIFTIVYIIVKASKFRRENGYGKIFKKEFLKKVNEKFGQTKK